MAVNGVEIKVGQTWITRDGREVYVESRDSNGTYPYNIQDHKGGAFTHSVTPTGYEYGSTRTSPSDLVRLKTTQTQKPQPEGDKYRDINGIPLKIGDRVKVVAKPTPGKTIKTPEYTNSWPACSMDRYVNDGKSKKVTHITNTGVYIENTQNMGFPAWVLEKVEDKFQDTLENTYSGDALAMAKALFKP